MEKHEPRCQVGASSEDEKGLRGPAESTVSAGRGQDQMCDGLQGMRRGHRKSPLLGELE